jgi:gas vesicle protein
METERFDFLSVLGAFFVGGILGAAAGFLFAPKSGKEMREDLRETAGKTLEEARHVYSETRARADALLEDAKRKADELKREADRHLQEARQKAGRLVAGAGRWQEPEKRSTNNPKNEPTNPVCLESPEEILGGMS